MDALLPFLQQAESAAYLAMAVFLRVYAFIYFLPGLAELIVPHRIKIAGAAAFAMTLDLHVKAVATLVESYQVLPFGVAPVAGDVAEWTVNRVAHAFNLAISLSMPFILAAFVYNLALGFINRAMPQLMVAFVGLPAITGLGLMLLMLTAGAAITIWHDHLDRALLAPLGVS